MHQYPKQVESCDNSTLYSRLVDSPQAQACSYDQQPVGMHQCDLVERNPAVSDEAAEDPHCCRRSPVQKEQRTAHHCVMDDRPESDDVWNEVLPLHSDVNEI